LTGDDGDDWCEAAAEVGAVGHAIGPEAKLRDRYGEWKGVSGIDPGGAVLVRPDGFVCFRAPAAVADPAAELRAALGRALGRVRETV